MNANTASTTSPAIVPIILGIVTALLIAAVLSGRQWPLIAEPRMALALLVVLGMAMCASGGIGPAFAEGRWAAPLALISMAIGVVIILIAALTFFGVALPGIAGAREAFIAVAALGAVKVLLTLLDRIV